MPLVGSSRMMTLRLRRQPFGDHHLLLVAARQRADVLVERGGAQIEARGVFAGQREFLGEAEEAVARGFRTSEGSVTFWKIGRPTMAPCRPRSSGT